MGHAFGIFLAHVGALQSLRSFRRRLPLALGVMNPTLRLRRVSLALVASSLVALFSCSAPPLRDSDSAFVKTKCDPTGRYKRSGYADTRGAIIWMTHTAPAMKFGLSLDEVWFGIECGYDSVRTQLQDTERLEQIEESRRLLRTSVALFKAGDRTQAVRTAQAAEELFVALRRVGGHRLTRQEFAETENSTNEVNEP